MESKVKVVEKKVTVARPTRPLRDGWTPYDLLQRITDESHEMHAFTTSVYSAGNTMTVTCSCNARFSIDSDAAAVLSCSLDDIAKRLKRFLLVASTH